MTRIVSKLMIAGCALALSVGTAAAAEYKWDLSDEYQAGSIFGESDILFAKTIKEKSGGKVEVTLHLGGALGYKSKDQFDAVGDGAIPLADSYTGAWVGIDPIFNVSALPFLVSNFKDVRALYDASKPYYDEIFTKNNQKLLFASPWPPSGIWGKRPLDSLAALKNVRIRTYDPNGTLTMKAAGAASIQLSWADVIPQLATGGIEAVLTSAEGGVGAKFWEHLNHFTEINYASPLSMTHMNLKLYNSLPADIRKAVDETVVVVEKRNWEAVVTRVEENYKEMRSHGMTIVTGVSKDYLAALNKAAEGAHKDWAAKMGERGNKILADFRKRTGR